MKKTKINIVWIPVVKNNIIHDQKNIEKVIHYHASRAIKLLKIDVPEITFTVHPYWAGWGAGTESKEWIRLNVPLKWKSLKSKNEFLENILPVSIYHELSHIAQNYVFSPEKKYPAHTLLRSLICEGIALSLEEEVFPQYRPSYALYTESALKKWFPLVRKEKHDKNYDYWEWFHGKGKPRWLGYKLGKFICDKAKINNPTLTALQMISMSPQEVLKLSKIKL